MSSESNESRPPAPAVSSSPPAVPGDSAKKAGRGGLFVLAAKVFFLGLGFVQQVVLQRVLGAADFGVLALVLAQSNIPNNVIVAASVQGVSRAVAGAPGGAQSPSGRAALRGALAVHGPLALLFGGAFAFAAPFLADAVRAPRIAAPLLVMAVVLTFYGIYAPLVGALNGDGRFGAQAFLDGTYATLRTAGLIGGALLLAHFGTSGDPLRGDRVHGATLGIAIASGLIILLAAFFLSRGKALATDARVTPFDIKAYILFLLPIMATQLFVNLLMQVDITLLGRFLGDSAKAAATKDPAEASAAMIGVYRACQLLAFLPYQLLFSVTQVLFPMVAKADADGDREGVKAAVSRGARLACIAGGLLVTVLATLPSPLLHVVSPANIAAHGGNTLRILALSQGIFAILGIATTVLSSLKKALTSAAITLVALGATATVAFVLVPTAPFGTDQLQRMALATGAGLTVGLVLAGVAVYRAAGAFVPLKTALRVGGILAVFVFLGTLLPALGKVATLGAAAAVAVLYLVALVVTGELGKADLAVVARIAGKRT